MTLCEFRQLSYSQQIKLLYEDGTYIGKRKKTGLTFLLYQLAGFYIEISYSLYRLKIEGLNFSESMEMLEPYLEQVEIELLV